MIREALLSCQFVPAIKWEPPFRRLYVLYVAIQEWASNGTKNTYDVTVDVLQVAQARSR